MKYPVELVVFDIAGTTVKDNGEIVVAFHDAMKEYGYSIPIGTIGLLMGYKKPEAIRMMLDEYEPDTAKVTPEFVDAIHERFLELMIEYYSTTNDLSPLPHVEEVFKYLKDKSIKVGLDTGFSRDITDVIIDRLGWVRDGKIDYVESSDEVPAGRPQPYMIQRMMAEAGIEDSSKVIKLGDTEVDVNEGKNAGCLFSIAVTTGAFTKEQLELYEPSFIIDELKELINILEN
ncbi:HAD hydrolase-like protein [Danxiaibacter flavus]|uniref:HAD hydrolase-like protein n=1 Tax=Danxiaibacter flavus TaxID=3049108 RepID=A0ABV3ZL61_9BACT|nr:HAD hydrolase-like protein [Chitinophagaceae bacterium DXS]